MANEHIARLEKIGLGKESVSGTPVSATYWIPKVSGKFEPEFDKAKDQSAYGVIDETFDSKTVAERTKVELSGIARDVMLGHLLMATFGQDTVCLFGTRSGGSGTFTIGETVTGGTSSATGVVRRKDGTTEMLISVTSGTFQTGETITGGTSSATGALAFDSGVRAHLFERLNTNAHPSYTLYGKSDVADNRAAYGMIESLELEMVVKEMMKFSSTWVANKKASTSSSPSFVEDNEWLSAHASLKLASAVSGLQAASVTAVHRFRATVAKNVEDYQAFGSLDIASRHNRQFTVDGEIEAIFNSETLQDLVSDSTKRAMRFEVTNTDKTIGSSSNPRLRLDFARCSFESWSQSDDNNALVMQTIGFDGEFDATESNTVVAVLVCDQTTTF